MVSFAFFAASREIRAVLKFSKVTILPHAKARSREVKDEFLRVLRGFA
jgi:hypothetical protein